MQNRGEYSIIRPRLAEPQGAQVGTMEQSNAKRLDAHAPFESVRGDEKFSKLELHKDSVLNSILNILDPTEYQNATPCKYHLFRV